MKKVLVTGCNGFIGGAVCKKLVEKGYDVVGIDIHEGNNSTIPTYAVDITDHIRLAEDIPWDDIDFVYHLAAMANINEARELPRKCYDVNVTGTFNIAQMCQKHDIPICYISTQCVYGNQKEFPVKEDVNIPLPTEIYGATKYMGEQVIRMLKRWVILRYGTVVGPDMREALATHIFLTKAIERKPMPIDGDGKQTRDWIYIDDLVDATVKVIDTYFNGCFPNGEVINISGKEAHTVLEMAETCWRVVHGSKDGMAIYFREDRPGNIIHEETSKAKASVLLGWKPKTSLREAMEEVYNEWKNR